MKTPVASKGHQIVKANALVRPRRARSLLAVIATASNANRPNAVRYSAEADKRSWRSMQELLVETLF
jgi:hypothetical protein